MPEIKKPEVTWMDAFTLIGRVCIGVKIRENGDVFTATTGPEGLEITCEGIEFGEYGRLLVRIRDIESGRELIRLYQPKTLARDLGAESVYTLEFL